MTSLILSEKPFSFHFRDDLNLQVLLFNDFEPWFIAKEISNILGYSETSKMLKRLDNDERKTVARNERSFSIELFGNQGSLILINESGLYNSIFGSKLSFAKEFKKWVTREVLPSIRKTGSYSLQNPNEPDLELIEKRVKLVSYSKNLFLDFEKIFLKIGISEKNELAITSNRAVAKETGIDFIQLSERQGLEAKEKFFTVTELCEVVRNSDQFANEFKISVSTKDGLKPRPQNLNLLLEFSEFQFRENGEWKLTEKGEAFGKLSQNKSKYSDKTVYHLVWSKKVLDNLK
jgi:prophage antirepressor-like protein